MTAAPASAGGSFDEFIGLLRDFDTAMLVTRRDNELRSRPMSIADCTEAARLWFVTSVDSGKLEELTDFPYVNVALQDGQRFLSISGTARAIRNRDKARELWSPEQRVWFEEGLSDPALILLEVVPTYAEYWDRSGTEGLKFLLEEARAALSGETPPQPDESVHGKIDFPE